MGYSRVDDDQFTGSTVDQPEQGKGIGNMVKQARDEHDVELLFPFRQLFLHVPVNELEVRQCQQLASQLAPLETDPARLDADDRLNAYGRELESLVDALGLAD